MDFSKLCAVNSVAEETVKVLDSVEDSKKNERIKRIKRIKDARERYIKSKKNFRITDEYKNLLKRIKDELTETENTEEVITKVTEFLDEAPAEQVVTAAIEVIGEAVDALEDQVAVLTDEGTTEEDITDSKNSVHEGDTLKNSETGKSFKVDRIVNGSTGLWAVGNVDGKKIEVRVTDPKWEVVK